MNTETPELVAPRTSSCGPCGALHTWQPINDFWGGLKGGEVIRLGIEGLGEQRQKVGHA